MAASKAKDLAYAPYSNFPVGAAIRLQNGLIFSGCNVENASFGATICAERTAVMKACSEATPVIVEHVLVLAPTERVIPPCGQCLQVLAEFCSPETLIYLYSLPKKILNKPRGNRSAKVKVSLLPLIYKLKDLLPLSFRRQNLQDSPFAKRSGRPDPGPEFGRTNSRLKKKKTGNLSS